MCNLIVLVSSCSHEYFIWLPQVTVGEEDLGDLLAHLKIAGGRGQRPYEFEARRGQEFSFTSLRYRLKGGCFPSIGGRL